MDMVQTNLKYSHHREWRSSKLLISTAKVCGYSSLKIKGFTVKIKETQIYWDSIKIFRKFTTIGRCFEIFEEYADLLFENVADYYFFHNNRKEKWTVHRITTNSILSRKVNWRLFKIT